MCKAAMGVKTNRAFLSSDDERLMVILALTVIYPLVIGSFFVLFLFWILPSLLTPPGAVTPLVMSPGFWLHGYWLLAALVWVLLLAVLLPLMGPIAPVSSKSASYKRESGVSVKEETELTPLRASEKNGKVDPNAKASAGAALSAYQSVSLSDGSGDSSASSRKSSRDKLVTADSMDGIDSVERTASQLDLEVQGSASPNRSTSSLTERKKLTQSGEFLSDCLGSVQSENEVEGEIIRGNTNCQVHAQDDVDDQSSDEGVLEPLMKSDDRSSCEEVPCERANHDRQPSQYAEIGKAELLVAQAPVDEAINEAVIEVEQQHEDTAVEEVAPLRPKKANALPALDTSRASQVHCSAPSTMSPRESNVVFLYVNSDKEN